MKVTPTAISEVLVFEPQVNGGARGFFFESFNARRFEALSGQRVNFVEHNHNRSAKNVLRGLHCRSGSRKGNWCGSSPARYSMWSSIYAPPRLFFGRWVDTLLSAENRRQIWVPPGFAHGFLVTSDSAECLYKTTDYRAPKHQRSILWSDPALAIDWPISSAPIVSASDSGATLLAHADVFP